jgi:hypothetical protein
MLKEIEINVNDMNLFIMHCTCTLNCQAVPINVYKKTTSFTGEIWTWRQTESSHVKTQAEEGAWQTLPHSLGGTSPAHSWLLGVLPQNCGTTRSCGSSRPVHGFVTDMESQMPALMVERVEQQSLLISEPRPPAKCHGDPPCTEHFGMVTRW